MKPRAEQTAYNLKLEELRLRLSVLERDPATEAPNRTEILQSLREILNDWESAAGTPADAVKVTRMARLEAVANAARRYLEAVRIAEAKQPGWEQMLTLSRKALEVAVRQT